MDARVTRASARPRGAALAILGLTLATIAGAFAFQAAGYPPCDLCLKERLPFYAGMALAAAAFAMAWRGPSAAAGWAFLLIAAVFVLSAATGAYHAGVEWGFWPGPADCTGTFDRAATNADFLHQLQTVRVVRCDAAAIRILGLSLAGWNVVVSLVIAALALIGWRSGRG